MESEQRDLALNHYHDHGASLLRGFVPQATVRLFLEESLRLWAAFESSSARNLRVGLRVDTFGKVMPNSLDPVSDVSTVFAAVNADPVLVSLAEAGLGTSVVTMKDKLIYKWPGTPGFGLHRDGDYNTPKTGVPGSEFMTACIALDPVTRAKGPIELFPQLRFRALRSRPNEPRDIDNGAIEDMEPFGPALDAGDVLLFDGLIPHRSGGNMSSQPRRVYMVTYVPAKYHEIRERYYRARMEEQAEERRALGYF